MRVAQISVVVLVVLGVAVGALVLVLNTTGSSKPCVSASKALSLNAAAAAKIKQLPPSHDNDAGRARLPDATPDADYDAGHPHPVVCAP
ncbi:MAG TPA: hypothetical protein PLG60_00085 [Acidimicrobiales bacterium]|nr:hypothetical protein [Acidimicrobiales bacterium]